MSEGTVTNELGTATLSLGHHSKHSLAPRLHAAAAAGFQVIDLFDEDWAAYLFENGLDGSDPWEPTDAKFVVARKLRDLVTSLGMRIVCTQPLREIEGHLVPEERKAALQRVAARFPFMRAFDTDLVFMCSNIRPDDGIRCTSSFQTVVRDLAELGDMALEFSRGDGGRLLRIGYEPLSWGRRNTWASAWEVVRAADRANVGLILDSFNMLAVEFADPYSSEGEGGMLYKSRTQALRILRQSLTAMVATIPADRIFFVQLGDAMRVNARTFKPPADPSVPRLLPWSRYHRLWPAEQDRGGYMPVDMVLAAILELGYRGPLSLEVFSTSLYEQGVNVPQQLASRGINGLKTLINQAQTVPGFTKASL